MTDTMKTIKEIMKNRGYTQRDVALIIGVSETSMSRWMKGNRTPNIRIIERIAKAIGFDIVLKHRMDDTGGVGCCFETGAERKKRLKEHVETLKEMRQTMLNDENWEYMERLIEACTAGAMAIQRIIKEDFGESEDKE